MTNKIKEIEHYIHASTYNFVWGSISIGIKNSLKFPMNYQIYYDICNAINNSIETK